MKQKVGVNEVLPISQMIPLGLQHLFAMFGATVLVPLLTGLNPSVALFTAGLGTLLFTVITKGKVPAYLGSSFAFIGPIGTVAAKWGLSYALGGTIAVGFLYVLISAIISFVGVNWIDRVLPPIVIGSVIVVIGLGLAPVGVEWAGLAEEGFDILHSPILQVSMFTLLVTIIATIFFRGFLAVIPILIGIVSGYLLAIPLGLVDFSQVSSSAWLAFPDFTAPKFSLPAIAVIFPVGLATIAEHLGDVAVISRVVGRNFYKDPGLHRTLLGDGAATALAGLFGGPPNTTYGENVGVMAITGVYSVWVIRLAAIFAILLSFLPKVGVLIQTIPQPVMGGVTIVLFGVIASSGLRTMVESGIDFGNKRNLVIASAILVLGIGGAKAGPLSGVGLATVVGIVLNLVLPRNLSEDTEEEEEAGERVSSEPALERS